MSQYTQEQKSKTPEYQLTLFKMQGHSQWRLTLEQNFLRSAAVTDVKIVIIDRLSGEVRTR